MRRSSRVVDVVVVLALAPVWVPLGAMVALLVYLDSPGPVLYRATRVGRGGHGFQMLKFRTMRHGFEGPAVSSATDARFTPLGRALARSRLDEVPQLINVLRGQMRLVGPRPESRVFVDAFPREYEEILQIAPGLTGPAAIEFAWEGEILAAAEEHDRELKYTREILPMKVMIDQAYVRERSLAGDLLLVAYTMALPARCIHRRLAARVRDARSPLRIQLYRGLSLASLSAFIAGFTIDGRGML